MKWSSLELSLLSLIQGLILAFLIFLTVLGGCALTECLDVKDENFLPLALITSSLIISGVLGLMLVFEMAPKVRTFFAAFVLWLAAGVAVIIAELWPFGVILAWALGVVIFGVMTFGMWEISDD